MYVSPDRICMVSGGDARLLKVCLTRYRSLEGMIGYLRYVSPDRICMVSGGDDRLLKVMKARYFIFQHFNL